MKRKKKSQIKLKPKHYKNSKFVIWFCITIIVLVLVFDLTRTLYKLILLILITILFTLGFNEALTRLRMKNEEIPLKKIESFGTLILKNIFEYFIWLFGILLILYGMFFIFFFPDIVFDNYSLKFFTTLSLIFLAIGSLIAVAGIFMNAMKTEFKNLSKYYKSFKNTGICVIILSGFILSYTIISDNLFLIKFVFYSSLLLGCGLLLLESIYIKNKNAIYILSCIFGILFVILLIDFSTPKAFILDRFFIPFPFIRLNKSSFAFSFIIVLIERTSFVIFLILGLFYLLDYSDLKQEKYTREREILKTIIFITICIWISFLLLLIIFIF